MYISSLSLSTYSVCVYIYIYIFDCKKKRLREVDEDRDDAGLSIVKFVPVKQETGGSEAMLIDQKRFS